MIKFLIFFLCLFFSAASYATFTFPVGFFGGAAEPTDWAQVGNDLNIAIGTPAMAGLSSNRIAFIDITNDDLRTYDFDGTDWAQVGNALGIVDMLEPAIAFLNSNRIAFIDSFNDDLRTFDFT